MFTKVDNMVAYEMSLNKLQKVEILVTPFCPQQN